MESRPSRTPEIPVASTTPSATASTTTPPVKARRRPGVLHRAGLRSAGVRDPARLCSPGPPPPRVRSGVAGAEGGEGATVTGSSVLLKSDGGPGAEMDAVALGHGNRRVGLEPDVVQRGAIGRAWI